MSEDKQEGEQGSHVSRRDISELVKLMKDMVLKCRTVSKGVLLKIDSPDALHNRTRNTIQQLHTTTLMS